MKWIFWNRTQPATSDSCGTIDPLLSLYADGMASAEEARRVETHLPGCAACHASLVWTQATQRAIASRPVVSPPADLRARIASAIAASSAAPVPVSLTARRVFALRPAYAAAASLTILGVAVSYGLLHQSSFVAVHPAKLPQVAVAPPINPPVPVVKTMTGPAVKSHVLRRPAATPKPVRLNPDLMARAQPDKAEPMAVKTPAGAGSVTKTPARPAPMMASVKPHGPTVKKPILSRFKPELMATTKLPVEPHKAPVVKPEDRKPEVVAIAAPPVPVNVGAPSIKPDPTPTIVVASSHENHARTGELLRLGAYVGQMKSFTHNTVSREAANGATYAARTLNLDKTPGIDFVHGPTH